MADRKRKRQQYRAEHREQKTSRPAAPPRVTWEIQRGWKVYTADSETLGAVGEVSPADDYFVVSGGFLLRRHTVYVPMRYVRGAGQGRISLRVTKAEALKWRQPPPARRPLTDDTGASLRVAPRVRPWSQWPRGTFPRRRWPRAPPSNSRRLGRPVGARLSWSPRLQPTNSPRHWPRLITPVRLPR